MFKLIIIRLFLIRNNFENHKTVSNNKKANIYFASKDHKQNMAICIY